MKGKRRFNRLHAGNGKDLQVNVDFSLSKDYISISNSKFKKQNSMFGSIGFPEILLILALALLVFGPKKLPEIGRSIGRALREFRRTSDEIKEKIEEEIQADELRDIKKEFEKGIEEDEEGKKDS
jgi:sec-independent protein translocase protein TatA